MSFLHRAWAEIDIAALIHNFEIIKSKSKDSLIMAVVKADAYGHSVKDIAPVLQENGADWFAVSNIEEAFHLRKIGVNRPILILGYTPADMAEQLAVYNISQCVYSSQYAERLSDEAQKKGVEVKIHIKLDTGMGRLGFDCRDDALLGLNQAVSAARLKNFKLEGIFTHFAVSDRTEETEDGFTLEQYNRFVRACDYFKSCGLEPEICHCCNSAATCLDEDKHLDVCRPGIIIYGLTPSSQLVLEESFIPVMTFKSVVSMVKTVKKGDTVSYGRTFKAEKEMRLATVSVGYADGYPRALSNKGYVLINGKRAPIVGRVCMDQMMIDVSDIEEVSLGDEVVLFGKGLPVEELADICDTINYEIVCGISPRVPRVVL